MPEASQTVEFVRLHLIYFDEVKHDDDKQAAYWLGAVSSYPHLCWALAAGGTLEDRPRYQNGPCFDNFPFPTSTPKQQLRIRDLAEQLDAHRNRQQTQHPDLTLTGIYNVLEKLKSGEALTTKEKVIHEQGLVTVLKQLHDELDLAVLETYGWSDLASLMQVVNGNATVPSDSDRLPDSAGTAVSAADGTPVTWSARVMFAAHKGKATSIAPIARRMALDSFIALVATS